MHTPRLTGSPAFVQQPGVACRLLTTAQPIGTEHASLLDGWIALACEWQSRGAPGAWCNRSLVLRMLHMRSRVGMPPAAYAMLSMHGRKPPLLCVFS